MANIPLKIVGMRVKCQCIQGEEGKEIKVLEKLDPDTRTPTEKISGVNNGIPMDKVKNVSDRNAVKMKIQLTSHQVNDVFEMTLLYIVKDEDSKG